MSESIADDDRFYPNQCRRRFATAYRDWLNARAELAAPSKTDGTVDNAVETLDAAFATMFTTPCWEADQVKQKLEVVKAWFEEQFVDDGPAAPIFNRLGFLGLESLRGDLANLFEFEQERRGKAPGDQSTGRMPSNWQGSIWKTVLPPRQQERCMPTSSPVGAQSAERSRSAILARCSPTLISSSLTVAPGGHWRRCPKPAITRSCPIGNSKPPMMPRRIKIRRVAFMRGWKGWILTI